MRFPQGSATNVASISEAPSATRTNSQANTNLNGNCAECSRPGENNALHVAVAVGALGLLAVAAGYLNIKISTGK